MSQPNAKEYLKFLKKDDYRMLIGTFFPKIILNQRGDLLELPWSLSEKPTVVYTMSITCSYCDFDVIKKFVRVTPQFRHIMLVEADKDSFLMDGWMDMSLEIHFCEISVVNESLKYGTMVPWAFFMNQVGQIVTSGASNTLEDVERLSEPFMLVYSERGAL